MGKAKMTFEELNFPASVKKHFDDMCANESWSWDGLAWAMVTRYGTSDLEDFLFLLGKRLKEYQDSDCTYDQDGKPTFTPKKEAKVK